MIRPGFLTDAERRELRALARDGLSEARVARRANALVLLNDGWSCTAVAEALLMDDDTIRSWYKIYSEDGLFGLLAFDYTGSQSYLTHDQEAALRGWIRSSVPRSVNEIGAWIASNFNIDYSRSGLIALLHRLKISYRKPDLVPLNLDPVKQQAFIEDYEQTLNTLGPNETVVFVDAVHPAHQARVVECWAPEGEKIAIAPTSGRDRLNIHGAINLETGQTQMIEFLTVDALSTIQLLKSILLAYPTMCLIHIYLDNARYHHAKLVKEWLACNGARIKLHFIPAYSPHLNPIERLWGVMHKNLTHNKSYGTLSEFQEKVMTFLKHDIQRRWDKLRDSVTDNFRVINPADFRVVS